MMHVALRLLDGERVEHLFHLQHSQRRDVEDLSLASLEQRGPVSPLNGIDLDHQRTDVRDPTTIHSDSVVDDPLAGELLEYCLECFLGLLQGRLVVFSEPELGDGGLQGFGLSLLALVLAGDFEDRLDLRTGKGLDSGVHLVAVVLAYGPLFLRDVDLGCQLELEVDHLGDVTLGLVETLSHCFLI